MEFHLYDTFGRDINEFKVATVRLDDRAHSVYHGLNAIFHGWGIGLGGLGSWGGHVVDSFLNTIACGGAGRQTGHPQEQVARELTNAVPRWGGERRLGRNGVDASGEGVDDPGELGRLLSEGLRDEH